MNIYIRPICPVCGKQHAQAECPTLFGEQLASEAVDNISKPLADFINNRFVDKDTTISELRNENSTLTEQLRLANEDAERLANAFEIVCDLVDESGILVDRYALRLHEERIEKG